MKGVVFTEFLELVEDSFGLGTVDSVVSKGCPFHTGFTAVGTYDYRDLIAMVGELSQQTDTPASDLVFGFGKHLFGRFLEANPSAFEGIDNTFDFLKRVEYAIHVEVKKLNPDAELPQFRFPEPDEDGQFQIEYISTRPFADLCEGLIHGCIEHFGESLEVRRADLDGAPGTHAMFTLREKLA